MKILISVAPIAVLALTLTGCSHSNNLLMGTVSAVVDGHKIVVTDCYRTSVPAPQLEKSNDQKPAYRFTPCRDADLVIHGDELTVNGTPYKSIKSGDEILVDHGKVVINGKDAEISR